MKLAFFAALSTLLVMIGTARLAAHEVLPTISDLTADANGAVTWDLRINLEAFLAGIDLDAVEDTDDDSGSADYDALRALAAAELAPQVDALVDQWNQGAVLESVLPDGSNEHVTLTINALNIPDDVDFELPRVSELTLTGVSANSAALVVNWPTGSGALVVRQQGVEAPYTGYLAGGETSPPISVTGGSAPDAWQSFLDYIPVGFDHILPKGLDHILFVLGLFFLSTKWGPLLWQVSAFTLAHTVTLALGALGWVNIPGSIVEPLIAASIVYVAVENLFARGLTRWRPFIIFGFGLLHGLGFASVLGEFGLPEEQFIPALIGFNVGVEVGQLTVIALAAIVLAACAWMARKSDLSEAELPVGNYAVMFRAVSIPGSLLIAIIGAYWCVERVFF